MSSVISPVDAVDYLRDELNRNGRHEYVNGRVYALVGSTIAHARLITNVFGAAWSASQKTSCHVMTQCMLVSVAARNSFYYPDVVATCERLHGEQQTLAAPCFIVEVLSRKTASIDKREKRLAYTSLDSLHEYVLVYQDRMRVDVYQRAADAWDLRILHQPENAVPMSCLDSSISLEEIYRGVSMPLRVSEGLDEDDDEEWGFVMPSSRVL
jgi:Uma2 family endonuclease